MKIVEDFPPNIEKIKKHFDIEGKDLVMAYGDTLYNPHSADIPNHLMVHEEVHSKQHLEYPGGAEAFWNRCFEDASFRLKCETEAYRAQYAYICKMDPDRNRRAYFLHTLSTDFADPLYKLGISYARAVKIIKNLK